MDRTQAEQVIMNLAVNARDAMPQGGRLSFATRIVHREGHTGRSAGRPGEYVCLTVADTGSGMDERVMRHLFEPFFTTKEVGRGTGLGLATCHGIVHQNHGFIEVASDLGRGTTFAVYLPRSVGAAAECRTRDGGAISRGTETLLVVEDSQCVRAAIASSLRHHGYRILEAMDGGQALDIARQHQGRIDAVVSDVVMPGMNGRELVRRLREEGHRARMLLMSGYCGEASAREQDDGIDVIQKPFDPEQLVARLRTLLDGDGGPARQRSGPGG
jgi:CheY-like chemotaxis protein